MVNLNNLFIRIEELHINAKKISDDTGISTGNISDWKKGRSMPTALKLDILANYLNCSIDYLLGRTDTVNSILNGHEQTLLNEYRRQPKMQEAVDRLLGIQKTDEVTAIGHLAAFEGGTQEVEYTPEELEEAEKAVGKLSRLLNNKEK